VTRDRLHVTRRDNLLPVEQVLWLPGIVQHEETRLPTAEELEAVNKETRPRFLSPPKVAG
jgi:hypothetical protein